MTNTGGRARLRDLGIVIGRYPTGQYNAITDVPGVRVGHTTIIRDEPTIVRSGVTVILPRDGRIYQDYPFAGFFSFNGAGEMTGLPLIEEWGMLTSPVVLTNTNQIGTAHQAITRYGSKLNAGFAYRLPVIAETYDGFLNDMDSFPVQEEHVLGALESASSGPVAEGSVGGGTGMISYEFKGGIGTASRIVETAGQKYHLGALVQANHGSRHLLTVNGVRVGETLNVKRYPSPYHRVDPTVEPGTPIPETESSSIIVVIATDAPLLPGQCQRLSKRATVGLARTGGVGYNTSGDLFLTFATGNHYDPLATQPVNLSMLPNNSMDPLIEASAEAVEEAILNALTAAETMEGYQGHKAYGLPLDELMEIMIHAGQGRQ